MLSIITVVVLFSMISVWILLLTGVELGNVTLILPGVAAIFCVMLLQKTPWFSNNVQAPFTERLETGTTIVLVAQCQIFSILAGVFGVGAVTVGASFIFPGLIDSFVSHFTDSLSAVLYVKANSLVIAMVGFITAIMIYLYMLAEAKGMKRLSIFVVLVSGLAFFAVGSILVAPLPDELLLDDIFATQRLLGIDD